jgi:hypothetical protein
MLMAAAQDLVTRGAEVILLADTAIAPMLKGCGIRDCAFRRT